MINSDRDAIERFLEVLQQTARGRALVVNMLDSHTDALYSTSNLRAFLFDCARTYDDKLTVGANPVGIVEDVSGGYGIGGRNYLRQFNQGMFSPTDTQRLSHTMKTESFNRFVVDTRYKTAASGLPIVLPAVPTNSPAGMLDYRKRLADVTSDPVWYAPTASIGRPLPFRSNCWITTDYFGPDKDAPPYPDNAATEVRDELGLIEHQDGAFLLRLSFAASSLASLKPCELARPTFSDLGNARFRVKQPSRRAADYAAAGWGATVHLGNFGDPTFADATGTSERVSTSLPVSAFTGLTIEYLGRVEQDRGMTAKKDDDEAFAADLEAGRTARHIRDTLLSLIS